VNRRLPRAVLNSLHLLDRDEIELELRRNDLSPLERPSERESMRIVAERDAKANRVGHCASPVGHGLVPTIHVL